MSPRIAKAIHRPSGLYTGSTGPVVRSGSMCFSTRSERPYRFGSASPTENVTRSGTATATPSAIQRRALMHAPASRNVPPHAVHRVLACAPLKGQRGLKVGIVERLLRRRIQEPARNYLGRGDNSRPGLQVGHVRAPVFDPRLDALSEQRDPFLELDLRQSGGGHVRNAR